MPRNLGAVGFGTVLLSLVVLACGFAGSGDSGAHASVEPPAAIVLITLSGLRPDVVGALGGDGNWTPHIDAFAEQADWSGTAVVASSVPAASLASLMTGLPPWQHQVLGDEPAAPRPGVPLLSRSLSELGYRTRAHVPLDYDLERFGLLAGFDQVTEIEPLVADELFAPPGTDAPEFSWFHLREANPAYQRRDFEIPRLGPPVADLPWRFPSWRLLSYADPAVPYPAEERELAWLLFRHEVAAADQQVGLILDALRDSGLWDRAWIVVTASQGSEFGEHGQVLYAQNLGRKAIEVPLFVKSPASFEWPGRHAARVSQPRVWATLVEAAGGAAAPAHAPALGRESSLPLVSALYRRNGVNELSLVEGDVQLLWTTRFAPAEPEFYNAQLALSGGRPELRERPREILGRLGRAFGQTPPLSGRGEPPELRLERWQEAGGIEPIDDPELEREMALKLRRAWQRHVDRERSRVEEASSIRSCE